MILSCKARRKHRHENIDFKILARKANKQVKISCFLADKAYDSEENHRFIRYELKSEFVAPLKRLGNTINEFY